VPVIEPPARPSGVELLEARQLHPVEAAAPQVSPEHQLAMGHVWDEAVRASPTCLFDGPAVACAGVEWKDPGSLVLFWTRVTYRHYALRRVPGAVALPSLFVAVAQPTDDGGLLVGRMSSSTAAPDRVQFPGGSVEPPEDHRSLDGVELRRQAARELVEETGINTAPQDLTLWVVTRGEHGNVGVFFRAPSRPESVVRDRFAALVSAETALGRAPELKEIAIVRSPAELARLGGPHVDHLEPVVRRHAEALLRRDA
jgi:8-oxo-dGTP pyrophosphatase MutT (NUDIX family)